MNVVRKIALGLGILIVVGGLFGLAYPFVGEWINNRQHNKVVTEYQAAAQEIPKSRSEEMVAEAQAYNKKILARGVITTPVGEEMDEYLSMLPVSAATGVMGYLAIPAIDVKLPIYHGTDESVLQVGVGHLEGSSLPVGGKGTHTVLTGHSGLPSATIFTNLDQLRKGDIFTITVFDYSVTYEIDGMEVLKPEEVRFPIEPDIAECTLMTCTPVGANTHRLLVHAHQVQDVVQTEAAADSRDFPYVSVISGIVIILLDITVAVLILLRIRKSR